MAHPVNWFQISAKDVERLRSFYGDVFGWKMETAPDGRTRMVGAEKGGIPGGLSPSMDGNPSINIYVGVEDLPASLARIEQAGGKTAMQPMELPAGMGSIAGFVDPEGNWVGLWQPGQAARSSPRRTARPKSRGKAKARPKGKAKAKTKTAKARGARR
jgi:predicted enzyme related to lactoylglutathione lyase